MDVEVGLALTQHFLHAPHALDQWGEARRAERAGTDGNKGTDNGNKGTDNGNTGTDNGNKGTDNGNTGTDNGNKGTDNGNTGSMPIQDL